MTTPRHSAELIAGKVVAPWQGPVGFLRWRFRQILTLRAWRLFLHVAILTVLLVAGILDRDPAAIGPGASAAAWLVLWFLSPIAVDAWNRLLNRVRSGR